MHTKTEFARCITCDDDMSDFSIEGKYCSTKCYLSKREVTVKSQIPGYHLREIPKGVLGQLSKVREEVEEALEAEEQKNQIMVLIELSDMIGAIELYLEKNHPTIGLNDLISMKNATKRAFENGIRT